DYYCGMWHSSAYYIF
nr:immunoglobulin light chain junction region [Macaca mulatta]MOX80931.1 immunoglobulin light chain junction region [Macaca mulatta]MOX83400.1 immunoglobulin light chain junction region [Macaca mulatta]MOX83542.1 immunoglobulin light chain junction region [Macaca mulatta]MOX84302.1 immunoglobulin light chain junction region [Macaca mulatta]